MAKQNDAGYVEVGQQAPDFALPDQTGKTRHLKDYRGRWVVLYFYPKDDTPGCTKEACQFRDQLPKFEGTEAVVLGVSPDDEASHQKFIDKYELPFDLLADKDHQVCEQYGVWQEKNTFGRKSMGVARTTYLIDPEGKIARRWDKVNVEGHSDDVLATIETSR